MTRSQIYFKLVRNINILQFIFELIDIIKLHIDVIFLNKIWDICVIMIAKSKKSVIEQILFIVFFMHKKVICLHLKVN